MIDAYQVLREKEKEVERLRKEIDALRLVIPILDERDAIVTEGASQVSVSRLRPTAEVDGTPVISLRLTKSLEDSPNSK